MTEKIVFATVAQALSSLSLDKLGTVFYLAKGVYVVTWEGSGQFTREEWAAGNGPKNSVALRLVK